MSVAAAAASTWRRRSYQAGVWGVLHGRSGKTSGPFGRIALSINGALCFIAYEAISPGLRSDRRSSFSTS